MAERHRVVILGGGFGGLNAARALRKAPVAVTLVDQRNFHLFQPLLYQVATGSLSPGEIAAPLRGILTKQKNVRVLLGKASDMDPRGRVVYLEDGGKCEYDSLIVATGSTSTYFGHDEWRTWAPPLKTVEDATTIRHRILIAFEEAERAATQEERTAWLTFVIVGAGATGVELAGALGEIARHTLKNEFRSIRPEDARILVVDTSERVLSSYPEDLSKSAERQLLNLGVRVRTGVQVTCVDQGGVSLKTSTGQDHIASNTVIWAAGVTASDFGRQLALRTGAETIRSGAIKVEPDLTIPNYPNIYVVGDMAHIVGKDGKPLPGVAQVAMQSGSYAAKAIIKKLEGETNIEPFRYFNKGDLAVIGRARAVANIFGVHVSGFVAWLIWAFIHILYIVEFQSRILIMVHWGFLYLTFSRGARLITGQAAERPLETGQAMHKTAKTA